MIEAPCTVCRRSEHASAHVVDGWHVVRCTNCGHLYVNPRPTLDEVQRIYDESYFQNPAFTTTDHDAYFGYMDYLRDREHIQARLKTVLGRIERHEWKGRLLDVGCGLGFFVEVAALAGWEAHGLEINKYAVEWANEHVSDRVTFGTLEMLDVADGTFDCVTLFDVIEHVEDPRQTLLETWRLLRPGGLLVVATPDAGSWAARILGSRWLEMKRAPEHLHFFSMRTLSQVLALTGYSAFEWHSMGKITTLRTVLADLKFYSPPLFARLERWLDRWGWGDAVVDVDPRTKMCVYARKTGLPPPLESTARVVPSEVTRVGKRKLATRP